MNKEQKEKSVFFARYLHQEVYMRQWYDTPMILYPSLIGLDKTSLFEGHLQLRPISDLTDEELVEVAKINTFNKQDISSISKEKLIQAGKSDIYFISEDLDRMDAINYRYLISRSICLDESAVEKGWAVLKPLNHN